MASEVEALLKVLDFCFTQVCWGSSIVPRVPAAPPSLPRLSTTQGRTHDAWGSSLKSNPHGVDFELFTGSAEHNFSPKLSFCTLTSVRGFISAEVVREPAGMNPWPHPG